MAMSVTQHRESNSSGGSSIDKHLDSSKYVRYTAEQVEALERVYLECPKPSSLRRQQLIRECPILSNIEPKQIKVWFQNRRCREKQRKEASRLHTVNRKLSALNKLLMEENNRLQKQVSQLPSTRAADATCDSAVTTPQHYMRDANTPAGFLSVAEETLTEFLSKATGTAVDWVQMPGMKPGPESVGMFAISQSCTGVAARACGLVSLEPTKVADILKDRLSWFRECRSLEVFTTVPAGNGGTIELVYTQTYAPTTLAPARDFWTLRYTTTLDNGSLVVCERSLSGSGAGPNAAAAAQFVRAEVLSSGYLIRPCEGGGSIIHIVDHLNLQPWSVPEVLQPLYESSKVVAQKMTIANVPPAALIRFLREHRSEWADFNVDAYSAASLKDGSNAYPGMRPTSFTGNQIIMPLGHTIEHEEMLEVVRLEGHSLAQEDAFVSRDIHLLQICSGIDENSVGPCSELIFAPIDEMFPDDAPLGDKKDATTGNRTLDLTSGLEVGLAASHAEGDASSCYSNRSVLTIAFQFPFDSSLQDNVVAMALQYVRSVISSVQRVAMAISPSGIDPASQPMLIFANQAGLDMMETTLVALQDITLDKIFDESGHKTLFADFAKIMQQVGSACPQWEDMFHMNKPLHGKSFLNKIIMFIA
ncbi:unnamed protein product [Lupinus luteus]|uniref:Uncharacterized protein n=1 Tax=Lupinus luteus TaxID=3873 RepID=A0AAV1YEA5_LUPLU